MAQGVKISEDLAWAILRMVFRGRPMEEITEDTKVSQRSVERILSRWRKTGEVVVDPSTYLPRRRPCEYDRIDLQVSHILWIM